jgi:poly-gamma-glutamate capsule biosynthesis protein CapA/YwtB (metallophosphatase superfamily)
MTNALTLLSVGDLVLDEPDPDSFFEPSRAILRSGDVVVGQVEVPHTTATSEVSTDVPAPPADPAALGALARAGFTVGTLAGNHVYDSGEVGVIDTVSYLRELGIVTAGAGRNLQEARSPAIVSRGDQAARVGILSYNLVGPRESWATSRKAGCAYVSILTHYELDHASPGGPPAVYTFADPVGLDAMTEDIAALSADVDLVAVCMHKGVGHTPVELAMYERPVARAAIEAGAHVVFAHHAHIMRGIEVYRGRPIYHGLGNFVSVTRALAVEGNDSPERRAWAEKRSRLYGFTPDPTMPFYPFHPESRNTVIATCRFDKRGLISAGFIPCWIDDQGRPAPAGRDEIGERVADYVMRISEAAGLDTEFEWAGDEVQIVGVDGRTADV